MGKLMTDVGSKKHWKFLILFTYFSLGAFALISQTMMMREFFVVVYGNEFIFAVLLTNWLIGIFTGAILGGAVAERNRNILMVFVISIMAMCLLLPIAITCTRLLYSISGTEAGTYISFLKAFLYSAMFIIPISFFIGFLFPVAAKVQVRYFGNPDAKAPKAEKVKNISNIYIFEAFGSLVSGIVYTFFLVGRFNSYQVATFITFPLLAMACLITWESRRFKILTAAILLFLINMGAMVPPVNARFETLSVKKRWESISPLPLLYSADSRYQNIAVAEMFGQYNLYLNTMYASVFPNDDDNMLLAAHLICQHPSPRRILVIGDAVSGLAKFLLRYPVDKVVSVEIDPKAVGTILKFLPSEDKNILSDKRFKIFIQDGRKYVKDLVQHGPGTGNVSADAETEAYAAGFDIVYVNVPEPSTLLLNRYYTREFFQDVSRLLIPDGVMALTITSSENYEKGIVTDYTASVYNTVKSVFPDVVVAPGTRNFIFASRVQGNVSDNPVVLAKRYAATGMKPHKVGMIFSSLYPPEKTRFIKHALEKRGNYNPNTDETPIASLYFNKIIGWYGKSNLAGLLGFFESIKLRDVILLLLVLVLFRMLYLSVSRGKINSMITRNNGKENSTDASNHRGTPKWMSLKTEKIKLEDSGRHLRFHTLLAVFSGGVAALSLELVILYTFQNNFGSIYHIVGFIIAIFMFGLPLGAYASNRMIARLKAKEQKDSSVGAVSDYENIPVIRWIILVQLAIAIISISLPRLMKLFLKIALLNQSIIFAETVLIGAAIGLIFPLSIHLYLGNRHGESGRTAGIIDAFDHLGAAVGAFFIGTIFIPVIGVQKVCLLVASFPVISALLLITDIVHLRRKTISTNYPTKYGGSKYDTTAFK
jgi:spermidine synthase